MKSETVMSFVTIMTIVLKSRNNFNLGVGFLELAGNHKNALQLLTQILKLSEIDAFIGSLLKVLNSV